MWNQFLTLNIIQGKIEKLRERLEAKSENDLDLISYCADFHQPNVNELLEKAGAFVDDRFEDSLLHVAITTENIETVKWLIDAGYSVNSYNRRDESALYVAVVSGCNEIVELLVEKNANVNGQQRTESILSCAARTRNESLTIFLLNHGADVNYEDNNGISPLHHGVRFHNPTIAALMLAKGADVNKRSVKKLTPLHIAADEGNLSVVKLLLDNGADISTRTSDRETPLMMSTGKPNTNSYEIVKLLLERGAKCIDQFDKTTVLCRALINCDCRTVKLLIDYGINVRLLDDWKNRTALHFAATNLHVDVLEYIFDYGIDVNTKDRDGRTPLHIAVKKGCKKGCKLLLSRGADVNCVDHDGYVPLYLAVISEKSTLVKLLLKYGAQVCSTNSLSLMNAARRGDITVRNILIEHVAKSVSSDTWVDQIEREAIEKDFEMNSYYKKCIEELEKIKIQKIYEDVCLFNILMERDMVSGYARNEDLIEAFDSAENKLKHDFPIYYSLLKKNFYREIKKQRVIKGAATFLNEIFNFYDPLHFANLKILSYLSEEDKIRINEIK